MTLFFAFVFSTFLASVYNGWMLTLFWKWFVMSAFTSVPMIGIAQAIGLSLLIAALTHQTQKNNKEEDFTHLFLLSFTKTTIFLVMGWIVHLFL